MTALGNEVTEMKNRVDEMTENLKTFESLPIEELKKENLELLNSNALLEEQFKMTSDKYEENLKLKEEMDEKYQNIEEAMEDKINEFASQNTLNTISEELKKMELDFDDLRNDMARKIINLR